LLQRYLLKDYKHASIPKNIECLLEKDGTPFAPACFYLWHVKCVNHATDNTCKAHANQIKQFLNHLRLYEIELSDVNSEVMQKYLYGVLFIQKKLSRNTISIHSSALKAFFEFCMERSFIKERDIDFSTVSDEQGLDEQTYIDQALNIKKLFMDGRSFKLLTEHVSGASSYIKERNKLILKLGYYAGLRTSDIASNPLITVGRLRRQIPNIKENPDVELPTSLDFSYINKKSKKKVNLIVDFELVQALHDFIYHYEFKDELKEEFCLISKSNGDPLIDDKIGTREFAYARNSIIDERSLSDTEKEIWVKRSFHILRKCFATNKVKWCREHGLPPSIIVRDYLGHADFKTSIKHYIYVDWLISEHDDKAYLEFLKAEESQSNQSYFKNGAKELI
jgi:site-specific recombinase XerD